MTTDHFRAAEELLAKASNENLPYDRAQVIATRAQAHATLAVLAEMERPDFTSGQEHRIARPTTPAEPPEPTETGARVVDRHGDMWVRNAGGPWICLLAPDVAMTLPWAELRAKYGPLEVKP